MALPIVFLNYAEMDKEKFIRILYKSNADISALVRRNDWITFNSNLKSFCVTATRQNLNLLKDLFAGLAYVNTHYLLSKPKIVSDDIIINKEVAFNQLLPIQEKLGTVLLIHKLGAEGGRILLKHKYNRKVHELLSSESFLNWDKLNRTFYFDASRKKLNEFILCFSSRLKIQLHHKIKITDISIKKMLLEQHYKKDYWFKSCPDSFMQLMSQGNFSWSTINTYHHYLLRFINAFKTCSIDQINSFTEKQINEYHYTMQQNNSFSINAVNQSTNAIKKYYGQVLQRPISTDRIIRPKLGKSKPKVYSPEEITKILKQDMYIKHKAIIMVLYSTGVRIEELLNLKPEDILSDRKLVFVKGGKGKKDRYTILSNATLNMLRTYYKEEKPVEYLFEGQFGGKYSPSSVRNMLEEKIKKAGVIKRGAAHTFRHSFATHLLESGVDLRVIQTLLGHESSTTTEIYTHVSNRHISRINNPLDSLVL
jgi:integrase/recombinase XerD